MIYSIKSSDIFSLIILVWQIHTFLSLDEALLSESLLDILLVSRPDLVPHSVDGLDCLHEVSVNIVHLNTGGDRLALSWGSIISRVL